MSYTSRHTGPNLTPEERDVQAALRRYSDDPNQGATDAEWTPTAMLYRAYVIWLAQHRWRFDPDAPDRLTPRQFGRAIRRVFPNVSRCHRSYHGQAQWGYSHIIGPESLCSSWLDPTAGWID